MKDKIFEYLRTTFAELGLSSKLLEGYAEYLSTITSDEDGIAAAAETIKPLLMLQQSETDKLRQKYADEAKKQRQQKEAESDEQQTKKNAQKQIEDKEKDKEKESGNKKQESEMPEYVLKLMKEVSDLKTSLQNRDRAVEIGNRRKEIDKLVSKLPKSVQKAYSRMDLDIAEDDYNELKTSISKEVEETLGEITIKKAAFNPPYAGDGNQDKAQIPTERADAIAERLVNK